MFRSTVPSIPIADASTGASIVSRDQAHAYYGLSPGLDFETKLFYKPDAAERLRKELHDPKYQVDVMALGTNTDPYQPDGHRQKLTRRILEVLAEYNHPFGIVTKSDLVLRDADIIAPMAEEGMAVVTLSVTTLDRDLARKLEPRAPTPPKRLAAIRHSCGAWNSTRCAYRPDDPGAERHGVGAYPRSRRKGRR